MLCFPFCSPEGCIGKGLSGLVFCMDSLENQSTNMLSARANLIETHRECDEHEKRNLKRQQ